MIDHRGRPTQPVIHRCSRNKERIPTHLLMVELSRFIDCRDAPAPSQVIVHRDGRFLPGESEDLLEGLRGIPRITLTSIKKDSNTRLGPGVEEGNYWRLDATRALLITNTQAKDTSMPHPLEIEIEEAGDQTLDDVAAQVFWLSRVCQGSAYHARRLPLTTSWANDMASTGKKVHIKGWEYHEE